MRYWTPVLLAITVCAFSVASAQKKLVIIGSSTSACFNVAYADCYVGRLESYFNQQAPFDTTIVNLALGGTNCYNGMPSSYISPYGVPYQPDPTRNITKALSLNPDVIIVNYPTNGYDVLRTDSILYCLRTIRDSANKKGIPCFVTTTQPRTSPSSFNTSAQKRKMAELKDSVLQEFGSFALDFWTGLITSDTAILYDSGDQIHMNASGHAVMFQRVQNKTIFLATLPASFLSFNALYKNNTAVINWSTARETDVAFYQLERSGDGRNFTAIGSVSANNGPGNNNYQYTDAQPLPGLGYYRVVIVDRDGKKHVSPVMSIRINTGKTAVLKTFAASASQVVVQLQASAAQTIQLQILNTLGSVISRETRKIQAGSSTVYINTPLLGNGIYHVQVIAADGALSSSFIKN